MYVRILHASGNYKFIFEICVACCLQEHEECQWIRETGFKLYMVVWDTKNTNSKIKTCFGACQIKSLCVNVSRKRCNILIVSKN